MKKGFTLVELSIVLVIIGLLIGGILVAQSLIESGKTLKITRDLSSYEMMVNQFKSRYKYLPGDGAKGFPWSGGTKRDWRIEYLETGTFWRDLYLAGFVDIAYNGSLTAGQDEHKGIRLPKIDYLNNGSAGLLAKYSQSGSSWTNTTSIYGKEGNMIALIGTQAGNGPLSAEQAFAIDRKIDDSRPGTGEYVTAPVYSRRNSTDCTIGGTTVSGDPKDIEWSFDTTATNCAVLHWID